MSELPKLGIITTHRVQRGFVVYGKFSPLTETQAAEVIRRAEAIDIILQLIGNVDHSIGHGENSAKFRGDLLNDIRSIAKIKQALKDVK